MKILLVSWYFPPTQTMGAIRVGKLAKYLYEGGHDVRVLTARDTGFRQTSRVEIPTEWIHATGWANVNAPPRYVARAIRHVLPRKPSGPSTEQSGSSPPSAASTPQPAGGQPGRLSRAYIDLVNFPDERIGWLPFAVRGGRRLLRQWKPDVIVGSGPPITSLLIADRLARSSGIPNVLEFRDRWIEDPYGQKPARRQKREKALQDRIIARASGIITVSEPWAEDYRKDYGQPTEVVYNGYDPTDYTSASPHGRTDDPDILEIVYTGIIYPGFRDPAPLFEAITLLDEDASRIRVTFYGTDPDHVAPMVRQFGVESNVTVQPPVPHAEAAAIQENGDVLLLMQWNNPREQGNVPGKLFEYLGARRPILAMGLPDGVPARIITEAKAGFFGNDPADIAVQLRHWLRQKRETGFLEPLPSEVASRFERGRQFDHLLNFLRECAANGVAGKTGRSSVDTAAAEAAESL